MALDSIKVQFSTPSTDPSLKSQAYELADRVQAKAPSDAYIWLNIDEQTAGTKALCRIVSGSGIFRAEATEQTGRDCLVQLERRILERIDCWKRRRFSTNPANMFGGQDGEQPGPKSSFAPGGLIYDYQVHGTEDRFKDESDRAIRDLRHYLGNDPSINLLIEKTNNGKGLYSVSMSVVGLGGRIHITKSGKNVPQLLKKVKKLTMNRARRQKEKAFKRRDIRVGRHSYAC